MNAQEYKDLVNTTYELILEELSRPHNIETAYPDFIKMYLFFKLLRGEAFTEIREHVGKYQEDIYAMEDNLFKIIEDFKSQIPPDSEITKFHMENMVPIGLRIK